MPKANRRKLHYTGVLATPITWHSSAKSLSFLGDLIVKDKDALAAEDARKNWLQILERLDALFAYYQIKNRDYHDLALKLALAHVPGFEIRAEGERRRGRPAAVEDGLQFFQRTAQYYEILMLRKKLGLSRACEKVSKREGSLSFGVAPETLRKRINSARREVGSSVNGACYEMAQNMLRMNVPIEFLRVPGVFEPLGRNSGAD